MSYLKEFVKNRVEKDSSVQITIRKKPEPPKFHSATSPLLSFHTPQEEFSIQFDIQSMDEQFLLNAFNNFSLLFNMELVRELLKKNFFEAALAIMKRNPHALVSANTSDLLLVISTSDSKNNNAYDAYLNRLSCFCALINSLPLTNSSGKIYKLIHESPFKNEIMRVIDAANLKNYYNAKILLKTIEETDPYPSQKKIECFKRVIEMATLQKAHKEPSINYLFFKFFLNDALIYSLMEKGFDPLLPRDFSDEYNSTPLAHAFTFSRRAFKLMIKETKGKRSPGMDIHFLTRAVLHENREILKNLLTCEDSVLHNENPIIRDRLIEDTIFYIITYESNQDTLEYLLKNFPKLDGKTSDGNTAMHVAVAEGCLKALYITCELRPDTIQKVNQLGNSPFSICLKDCPPRFMEVMLRYTETIPVDLIYKEFPDYYSQNSFFLVYNEVRTRNKRILLSLLCERTFNEHSVFFKDFLPLDMFRLILEWSRIEFVIPREGRKKHQGVKRIKFEDW